MIHAAIDRLIRILDLTPRDVRLAVERRLAPTLAAHCDHWMRRDSELTAALTLTHESTNNLRTRAETAEGLLRDAERDLTTARAETERWVAIAAERLRDAECERDASERALHNLATAAGKTVRERDDLRAAIAGALRELDAFTPLPVYEHTGRCIREAKGLLRATLGATVDPARLITAEEAHAAHGPLSRRGADLPAPAEPIPGTAFRVGDVVYHPTPDGWGPVRLTRRGAAPDGEGQCIVGERINDGGRVTIADYLLDADGCYRRATAEEIAAALAAQEKP